MSLFDYYGFKDEQKIVAIIPDNPRDAEFLAGRSGESLNEFKKQIERQSAQGKSPRGAIFGESGAGKTHCLQNLKAYFLIDPKLRDEGRRLYEPVYIRLSAWENKKKIFNQFFYSLIGSFEPGLLSTIARNCDNLARSKNIDLLKYVFEECKGVCRTNILQSMSIALDKLRIDASVNKGRDWFLGNLSKRDLESMEGASIINDARECADVLRSLNILLKKTHGSNFVFLIDEGQLFKEESLTVAEEQTLVKDNIKFLLDDPYIGMVFSFLNPSGQGGLGALENSFFYDETVRRRLGIESERQKGFVDLAVEMNDLTRVKDFICGDNSGKEGILQHWIDKNKAKKIIDEKKLKNTSPRFFPYDEDFVDRLIEKLDAQAGAKKPSRIIDILGDTMVEAFNEHKKYQLPIKADILDDLSIP